MALGQHDTGERVTTLAQTKTANLWAGEGAP